MTPTTDNLKSIWKEIIKAIEDKDLLRTKEIVDYYLGENNVSMDRMMVDALKCVRERLGYKELYLRALAACETKIGSKIY